MEQTNKENGTIYWHPAFYAGLQIELQDDADNLEFESEHLLSKKPMQIDILIIKKESSRPVKKNIYKAVIETVMRANQKLFQEVNGMSDIIMEIVQEKFDRKLKEELAKELDRQLPIEVEKELDRQLPIEVEKELAKKVEKEVKKKMENEKLTERISMVLKKCARDKTLAVIADEMETEPEEVLPIYNLIMENPGKTVEEIFTLYVGA